MIEGLLVFRKSSFHSLQRNMTIPISGKLRVEYILTLARNLLLISHGFHHRNWENMNWVEQKKKKRTIIHVFYLIHVKYFHDDFAAWMEVNGCWKEVTVEATNAEEQPCLGTSAAFAARGRAGEFGTDVACLEESTWNRQAARCGSL